MKTEEIPTKVYKPWQPMTNVCDLKTIGKLSEELGECSAAVARCIIQGIEESEPKSGYLNRYWLEDEIADVLVNVRLVIDRFKLDKDKIKKRRNAKLPLLLAWHNGTRCKHDKGINDYCLECGRINNT